MINHIYRYYIYVKLFDSSLNTFLDISNYAGKCGGLPRLTLLYLFIYLLKHKKKGNAILCR